MNFEVKLDFFEGPLDLLIYLVKKQEVPVTDINISIITDEFINYVEIMQAMDLETAGDFINMASALMRIKANELLPRDEREAREKDEDYISREIIIQKIKEYELFKDAAKDLKDLEEENFGTFYRSKPEVLEGTSENFLDKKDIGIYDLITAFSKVVKEKALRPEYHMEADDITIDGQIDFLMSEIMDKKEITFAELFKNEYRKIVIVTTFIAMLELIKLGQIRYKQDEHFKEILLTRRDIEEWEGPGSGILDENETPNDTPQEKEGEKV